MARILINDINVEKDLTEKEMENVMGGRWVRRFAGYRTTYRTRRITRTYYRVIRQAYTRTIMQRFPVRTPVFRNVWVA